MGRIVWRIGAATLLFALAASGAATAAGEPAPTAAAPEGTPLTRNEYVDQLEGVCRPRAEETQKAMKGVRQDVHTPSRIPAAARKFGTAAQIFGGTIDRIGKVSRPAADVGKLKEWFVYLGRQEEYLKQIAAQLRQGQTIKAQRLTARFIHNGNLANNVTLEFGFNWCSFKFSRYGF